MRLSSHQFLRNLTLLLALLAALMPTAVRLVHASGSQGNWQLVCTVGGTRWVDARALDDQAPGANQAQQGQDGETGAMQDCPLCTLGARALPLPNIDLQVSLVRWVVRYVLPISPVEFHGLDGGRPYALSPPMRAPPASAFLL